MKQVPTPYLNGIWNTKLPEQPACENRIEEILEPFKSSRTPVTWYVSPSCTPGNLGSLLEKHGLRFEGEYPGMALSLADLEQIKPASGLTIRRVENRTMMEQWIQVFSTVFNVPKDLQEKSMIYTEAVGFSPDAKSQRFIGLVDSRVVATSIISYPPGAVVLAGMTVLDEFRGRGIGAAMALHPLHLARQRGYKLAVLGSTEMGFPLYKKLGFKEYCKIIEYVGDFS
jgi:ribosomal protein S18 acetylase RimI-like enzyme